MIGEPGLTSVDQRSLILRLVTLTAPISTIEPCLTSRLVVSTSKTTKLWSPSNALANSTNGLGGRLDVRHPLGLADLLAQLILEVNDRRE